MTATRRLDEEFTRLESRFETLRNEYHICKRKLDSKCQALLILSKELDQCRSERDQFKLMAEQLRERYQGLKKHLMGKAPTVLEDSKRPFSHQGNTAVLYEEREQNKCLQFELEDMKQKLHDAQGDIKILREQIARQRVGTTDEGMNTRHFPAHEREDLVRQLEESREQYTQLERDLQQVLDEREETITEKDAYKSKYERLNQELNYILKGDEKRVVDLDAIIMENKYLQERLKQMEEEKTMAMATVSKYKNLLERKKMKSCLKLGQSRSGGLVITQKQVHQVLESKEDLMPSHQAMADIKALASALLDTVNDKNLALSHQRKTNKILGNRIAELEKKIKTLEVAGLWNIPSTMSGLEKLKAECDEVKTLIPKLSSSSDEDHHMNQSQDHHSQEEHTNQLYDCRQIEEEFCSPSPLSSSLTSSPLHSSSAHSVSYSSDLSTPSSSNCNTPLLENKLDNISCHSTPKSSPKRCRDHLLSNQVSDSCDSTSVNKDCNIQDRLKEDDFKKKKKRLESEKISERKSSSGVDVTDDQSRLISDTMEIVDTDTLDLPQDPHTTENGVNGHLDSPVDISPSDVDLQRMEEFCVDTENNDLSEDKLSQLVENMTTKMVSQSKSSTLDKNNQSETASYISSEYVSKTHDTSPDMSSPLLGDQDNQMTCNSHEGQRDVEC